MNRLNRKVEYALMALKFIGSKPLNEATSAQDVVAALDIPFDATAKVLQYLAQNNILRSERGASGGYRLIADLEKLSLFELTEMVLGPVPAAKCLETGAKCELKRRCNIMTPVMTLSSKLDGFYKTLSVGELLEVNRER